MKKRIKLAKKLLLSIMCISFTVPSNYISYSEARAVDSWEDNITSLPVTVDYFSSTEYRDNIYYIGGYDRATGNAKNIVQIYNTKTNTWSNGANMPTARYFTKSIQYNGKIYCFGGVNLEGAPTTGKTLDIVEIYDIQKNSWSSGPRMPETKEKMTVEIYNDKVLLIGGITSRETSTYSNYINVFNLKTNTWQADIPLNFLGTGFATEIYEDKLYILNGNYTEDSNAVHIYDLKTKTWSTGSEAPTKRHGVSSIRQGFNIYVFGGRGSYKNRKEVEVYNIKTNSWTQATPSPIEIHWGSAISKEDKVYCISGENTTGILSRYTLNPLPKATSNIDVYIKPQSILSVSLNTNTIKFDNFNFIDGAEVPNSIELSVSSSLPYQVKTSLASEMRNKDGTKTLNPDILSIKPNNESAYKTFNRVGESILLLDNQPATDSASIGIDMRINKGTMYDTDIYKGVLQIEVNQI